jgi:hypothetical protein
MYKLKKQSVHRTGSSLVIYKTKDMCAKKNIESLLIILTKTKQKNKSLLIKLNIRFYFF